MLKALLLYCFSGSIAVLPAYCQLPRRLENCLPIPTFSQEVKKEQELKQLQPVKIRIESMKLTAEDSLPADVAGRIANAVKAALDGIPLRPDEDWTEDVTTRVRDELQHYGYFYAATRQPRVRILSQTTQIQSVAIDVPLKAGVVYRLGEITFQHGTVWSPERLRSLFPIRRGDDFDTHAIAEGIEALRKAYGELGYIDFAAVPSIQDDTSSGVLNLTLDLDEGKQFRVGKVQILGTEQSVAQKLIEASGLQPGSVFNPMLVERFFDMNKSALPADASLDHDTGYQRHENEGTVDIIMDFRTCP